MTTIWSTHSMLRKHSASTCSSLWTIKFAATVGIGLQTCKNGPLLVHATTSWFASHSRRAAPQRLLSACFGACCKSPPACGPALSFSLPTTPAPIASCLQVRTGCCPDASAAQRPAGARSPAWPGRCTITMYAVRRHRSMRHATWKPEGQARPGSLSTGPTWLRRRDVSVPPGSGLPGHGHAAMRSTWA